MHMTMPVFPPIARMAIAKPFMGAKMRQRVRMFGSETDELHALVAPDVLPVEDFGGEHDDNGRIHNY